MVVNVINVLFFKKFASGQEDLLHDLDIEVVISCVRSILQLLDHLKDQGVGSSVRVIPDELENI